MPEKRWRWRGGGGTTRTPGCRAGTARWCCGEVVSAVLVAQLGGAAGSGMAWASVALVLYTGGGEVLQPGAREGGAPGAAAAGRS